jgi:MFS family permease
VTASPVQHSHLQRYVLRLLFCTQVVGGIGTTIGITVGALLAERLGGVGVSGIGQSCVVVGAALLAVPISRLMSARGRRPGLVLAYLLGATGAVLVVTAARLDQLPLFFLGMLLFGGGSAASLQARYTAVDLAPARHRGRQLSVIVWATTLGAVAAPNLVTVVDRVARQAGLPELTGPFALSAVAFAAIGTVLWLLLRPDPLLVARASPVDGPTPTPADTAPSGRPADPGSGAVPVQPEGSTVGPAPTGRIGAPGPLGWTGAPDPAGWPGSPDPVGSAAGSVPVGAVVGSAGSAVAPVGLAVAPGQPDAAGAGAGVGAGAGAGVGVVAGVGFGAGAAAGPGAGTADGPEVGAGRAPVRLRDSIAFLAGSPAARLGVAAIAIGHLVMVSVMSMTPVHMRGMVHGDLLRVVGIVLSVHIVGMYAFSPVVGWLADRVGRRAVILGGLILLLAACAVAGTAGHSTVRLTVGLALLGLGWSGTMVGGSTLVTDATPVPRRPAVQGLTDLCTGLAGALGGALSGLVVQLSGYPTLTLLAAVATVPLLGLALRRQVAAPG